MNKNSTYSDLNNMVNFTNFSNLHESVQEDQYLYIKNIAKEYEQGYLLLNGIGQTSATMYGGSKVSKNSQEYLLAFDIACYLASKKIAIITGGGPGIMEAGVEGALAKKGKAIAITVSLENEKPPEQVTSRIDLANFSVRKFLLRQSDFLLFFPGGIGTLDELFEVLTLAHTNKLLNKKIILCSSQFFTPIVDMFISLKVDNVNLVSSEVKECFNIINSVEEMKRIIEGS